MDITINTQTVEVLPGETIIETARRAGYQIPSLCYAQGARHTSSCMVCAVKNCLTGQLIPSCTTFPSEGMVIETEGEEVTQVRTLSLELLLSDHRADCEAPCSMVCSKGLDVERVLDLYDCGLVQEARALLAQTFRLPDIGCDDCKAPCEKACRHGTVDQAVAIRSIIREVAALDEEDTVFNGAGPVRPDKKMYLSRLGRFDSKEKQQLKETVRTPSRCLHCACAGKEGCKLRLYATGQGIKRSRYEASSALPVMHRVHVRDNIWFEQAKCIRCGLCVYNTSDGFTFKDRGFGMQVMLPEENRQNIPEHLARLCPTGAIYIKEIK
ncbi:MAG: 2Fe-2S iron-sulfur cluster-binding protein [Tannerellaceae bacterium]|nr:2Fe-2S iron-sulfur cluster-binding protein [Tannerellaceae bacterium]